MRDRPRITIGGLMSLVLLCALLLGLRRVPALYDRLLIVAAVLVWSPAILLVGVLTLNLLKAISIRRRGLRIGRSTTARSSGPRHTDASSRT